MMNHRLKSNRGFTLVEMLVSVAIFSIVLIVVMGSIITIIDTNRKARSLTIVMNDLNFSLESITRTIKTGEVTSPTTDGTYDSITVEDQDGDDVTYYFDDVNGSLIKNDGGGDISVTSDEMDIEDVRFVVRGNESSDNEQPRVLILIEGTAVVSPTISSSFKIQTTVSQRNLDI